LLTASVPKVALDHGFIEVGQLRAAACDPTQEIADQVEAPPRAVTSEPLVDEANRVTLDKLSVGAILEALEQPAPAQVIFCNHRPVLRC
jgi:hypothetical protein